MQKAVFRFILLTGITCFFPTNAASIATITALKSPVWLQQNETRSEIERNSGLKAGDQIITSVAGRVEMRIWSSTILKLNANSKMTLGTVGNTESSALDNQHDLFIHKGWACVTHTSHLDNDKILKLGIGDTTFVAIHHHGDICVLRDKGMSFVQLRAGSVQVTHSVDPNLIILSVAGSEIKIDDDGVYSLLFPDNDDYLALEITTPAKTETVNQAVDPVEAVETVEAIESAETVETIESDTVAVETIAKAESTPTTQNKDYIFSVYLFSTRSEEVAIRVNKKFQAAGHDTQIYENEIDSVTRYRIVVPGFESAQAAKDFSNSMIGKLGIKDTWIGRYKRKQ